MPSLTVGDATMKSPVWYSQTWEPSFVESAIALPSLNPVYTISPATAGDDATGPVTSLSQISAPVSAFSATTRLSPVAA